MAIYKGFTVQIVNDVAPYNDIVENIGFFALPIVQGKSGKSDSQGNWNNTDVGFTLLSEYTDEYNSLGGVSDYVEGASDYYNNVATYIPHIFRYDFSNFRGKRIRLYNDSGNYLVSGVIPNFGTMDGYNSDGDKITTGFPLMVYRWGDSSGFGCYAIIGDVSQDNVISLLYNVRLSSYSGVTGVSYYISNVSATQSNIDFLNSLSQYIEYTDPYAQGGNTDTSEMIGDFDITSDPIDFPPLPTFGAVDSGFISLYNPTLSELQNLARYMWTNPLFDISAWKKIFADPMDAILGLSIVPVAVPESSARSITVGNIVTDVSMKVATSQFVEVRCGSLNVNEFWSGYLDYEPYTKAEIYLPFCGVHQISVDDIMNKTIEVRYHIDILSGACCAFVKCGESVLYQFIGQCSSSIPISGNDFTNVINGVLSATTAIGSLVATGGASAPLAVPALSATALNALKPNIEKSGAMGGTGGMLAIQKPYLVLTRPKQAHPENQNHYTGYPSFITENLGDLSGYTEIEKIHLEGVPGTDAELSEIETLLKGGVIL